MVRLERTSYNEYCQTNKGSDHQYKPKQLAKWWRVQSGSEGLTGGMGYCSNVCRIGANLQLRHSLGYQSSS